MERVSPVSARAGSRTLTSSSPATSQVSASAASAQPAPAPTTSQAAIVGPMIRIAPRAPADRTLACCSWSRGTSCGSSAANAGQVNASTVPLSASRTISIHSSAASVRMRYAAAPCVAASTTLPTRRISTRGSRSAITPPNSRNSTIGMVLAASTAPSAPGELETSSTANASATGAIVLPIMLIVLEAKYHRKFRSRSGANALSRVMAHNLTTAAPGRGDRVSPVQQLPRPLDDVVDGEGRSRAERAHVEEPVDHPVVPHDVDGDAGLGEPGGVRLALVAQRVELGGDDERGRDCLRGCRAAARRARRPREGRRPRRRSG